MLHHTDFTPPKSDREIASHFQFETNWQENVFAVLESAAAEGAHPPIPLPLLSTLINLRTLQETRNVSRISTTPSSWGTH